MEGNPRHTNLAQAPSFSIHCLSARTAREYTLPTSDRPLHSIDNGQFFTSIQSLRDRMSTGAPKDLSRKNLHDRGPSGSERLEPYRLEQLPRAAHP